jgi:phosphohistidine phosphatase
MRLYIVRHGEASHRAETDAARPLTEYGRHSVTALWQTLAGEGIRPGILFASPFRRAMETAGCIQECYDALAITEQPLLVPESDPAAVMEWLITEDNRQAVTLVSHMPLVAALAGRLVGDEHVPFSTGTVACLDVDVPAPGGARLLWVRAP